MISFDKVEVVNRLKKDLVYDTIRNYTIHYDKTWIFDKYDISLPYIFWFPLMSVGRKRIVSVTPTNAWKAFV